MCGILWRINNYRGVRIVVPSFDPDLYVTMPTKCFCFLCFSWVCKQIVTGKSAHFKHCLEIGKKALWNWPSRFNLRIPSAILGMSLQFLLTDRQYILRVSHDPILDLLSRQENIIQLPSYGWENKPNHIKSPKQTQAILEVSKIRRFPFSELRHRGRLRRGAETTFLTLQGIFSSDGHDESWGPTSILWATTIVKKNTKKQHNNKKCVNI